MIEVVFIANGKEIKKVFDSAYKCRIFVNKARHSKKISLVSYPSYL